MTPGDKFSPQTVINFLTMLVTWVGIIILFDFLAFVIYYLKQEKEEHEKVVQGLKTKEEKKDWREVKAGMHEEISDQEEGENRDYTRRYYQHVGYHQADCSTCCLLFFQCFCNLGGMAREAKEVPIEKHDDLFSSLPDSSYLDD